MTLRVHSGNTTLPWTRDPEDIDTIQVEIPAGTDRITVDFDTLLENTISDHYAGGLRYPHLERIPGGHDYLSEILAPRSDKDH